MSMSVLTSKHHETPHGIVTASKPQQPNPPPFAGILKLYLWLFSRGSRAVTHSIAGMSRAEPQSLEPVAALQKHEHWLPQNGCPLSN